MLGVEDSKTFNWKDIPLLDCLIGNAKDAFYTLKVYQKLLKRVEDVGLTKLYERLVCPLSVAFRDMEYDGLLIDQQVLAKLRVDISERIAKLEGELKSSPRVPKDANLGSDHDLIKIIYSLYKKDKVWNIDEEVGFGIYPPVKTDKDQPKTDEETLTSIKTLIDEEVVRRKLNVKETV